MDKAGNEFSKGLFATRAAAVKYIKEYIYYLWESARLNMDGESLEDEKIRLSELLYDFLPRVETFDVKRGHDMWMNRFGITVRQLCESEEDING